MDMENEKVLVVRRWPLSSSVTPPSPQADLMVHLPQIREEHQNYISELARYSNEVSTAEPCRASENPSQLF